MFRTAIISALLLLLSVSAAVVQPVGSPGTLFITKISTSATPIGGNCYFPIQISMNLTWTDSNTIYRVNTNNFWLIVTTPNVVVTNSSASSYKNPNNQIKGFVMFPNIPVSLILGFAPTCLPSVGVARLMYLDSKFNFTFTLP